jgi:lipopolysaccharide transport system permease protein
MFVFGGIAGIPTDGLPQPLFYMAGILCWNYFSECLTKCSETFNANQHIFGKVYFPRLVVPFSIVISSLLKLAIQFVLFIVIYIFYIFKGYNPNITWYILLVPILIIMLAGLGLGFGLIISSMTTKYRDLRFLVSFGVQLWMYITPVIYPLSILKNNYPNYVWAIVVNPLTSIIETFKIAFLGQGTFEWTYLLYSLVFTILVMLFGMLTFNKVQRSFMDVI